jgi:hypothetical protein
MLSFGSPPVGILLPGLENAPDNYIEVLHQSEIDVFTNREYELTDVTVDVTVVAFLPKYFPRIRRKIQSTDRNHIHPYTSQEPISRLNELALDRAFR